MITEDYVSFETAELLKEKGFGDYKCSAMYDKNGILVPFSFKRVTNSEKREFVCDAPTLQMAMKYLRKKYKALITVFSSSQESWMYRITKPHQKLEDGLYGEDYESYEQAADEAIKYFVKTQIKGKNGNTQ